jgi:hypothetical protein
MERLKYRIAPIKVIYQIRPVIDDMKTRLNSY